MTNFGRYELSQEEFDIIKAGLYFSIQPDKTRKSDIFTTFEKIHHSFRNKFKSKKNENQIKVHLSYLANFYFYNCKPFPRHYFHIASYETLQKIKISLYRYKFVILDRKTYGEAIQETISDNSKFKKLNEDPPLKRETSLERFLRK